MSKSTKSLTKLSEALESNESLRKEALNSLNSVVSFEIQDKKTGETQYWVLDAKSEGTLKRTDKVADGAEIKIKIGDLQLRKLIDGKASAQKLFMTGKLKIKGNVMKAANVEKLLKFVGSSQISRETAGPSLTQTDGRVDPVPRLNRRRKTPGHHREAEKQFDQKYRIGRSFPVAVHCRAASENSVMHHRSVIGAIIGASNPALSESLVH
ncbi:hypothetical protein KL951_004560 [Ogataea haglerorum]|nr:hypothetical protein KL951_004560 [Ogataea haglerorum]